MSRTTADPATSAPARAESRARSSPLGKAVLAALIGVPLLAAALLAAFAWPASNIGPRDLPIGLTGPPPAVAAVTAQLDQRPGAFAVTSYTDATAIEAAIADRDIYAGIAITPSGPELLTSTAASPVVAQLLGEIARGIGEAQGVPATVRDVVPADPEDPRGTGLAVTVLPLAILGIAIGGATTLLVPGRLGRIGVLTVGAGMAGLSGVLVVQGALGIIGGDWWINAAVMALAVGAVAATVAGLGAILGRAGIGLGALIVVLLGNPLSGATSAPELLPAPWGAVGQALPPGAGATLLRGTAFFDGAGAAGPVWILLGWLAVGVALLVLAPVRSGHGA